MLPNADIALHNASVNRPNITSYISRSRCTTKMHNLSNMLST